MHDTNSSICRIDSSKRRLPSDTTTEPSPKRQKHAFPTRPPPAFWDNLSEVPLTKSALRELDRRNTAASSPTAAPTLRPSPRPSRRPITRRTAREQKAARISIQPATQYLGPPSQAELRQIRSFARQGGPDLSDLRAHHYEPTVVTSPSGMSSRLSSLGRRKRGSASSSKSALTPQTSQTNTTKSISPYDRAFQQHLLDHNIFPDDYEYPDGTVPPEPSNLDDILRVLAKRRPSLSPSRFSDSDFRRFKRADTHASKEWQVISTVIPIIEGEVRDSKCVSGQIPFTNLDHLTDRPLVPGNPDRYYGARPEQLNRQVRTELSKQIVPSTQHDLPIAPNFFLAVKGPGGSLEVAERQAFYDGALGARGIRSLQTYGDAELDSDNNASTITSIYHRGTLKLYASHTLSPAIPGTSGGYMSTQIKAYALTGDADAFRTGAAAYRNARDWTRQMRDEAIKKANESLMQDEQSQLAPPDDLALSFTSSQRTLTQFRLDSNTASSPGDSDTSADKLALEAPSAKRTRRYEQPVDTDPAL
ncbi:hypothetical protein GQX73_g433 [Xylaria multiplex]|uniref:Uncharacterized protein n=1 Tax=Xylaria multiplex TaxID=323545 RepID=A0A7C8MWM1_9PEZI|nr:hypothetical protein GQX73_g433 [Xylaria multiplex]